MARLLQMHICQEAEDQNRSCSHRWAEKQGKIQPRGLCFFLTSPFREHIRIENHFLAVSRVQ